MVALTNNTPLAIWIQVGVTNKKLLATWAVNNITNNALATWTVDVTDEALRRRELRVTATMTEVTVTVRSLSHESRPEEYESARELLYQWSDNLTLDNSAHTRYWEAQNNRLLNHLEEAKRYLPNRHRPRNDPALPTAPVRSHEERDLLKKQILQCWDLLDYYEKNNDREQVAYWQAARRQLYVRYKAAKTTLPPRNLPVPPAPIPPAPISNWTEYNPVRDNALKLCTAAVSLKDLDAPAAASYFKRARRLYERLEAAERHLPPRDPAEIKAESILTNTPASLSAVISHTAALLQPDASNHSTAERARQQGSAV